MFYDRPIVMIMIGLGGLLLVISHLFVVLVLWVGLKKQLNWTWMWKIIIKGHIINIVRYDLNKFTNIPS